MFEDQITTLIHTREFDKLVRIVRSVDVITRNLWPVDIQSRNTEITEHIVISHIRHYEQLENPSKSATRWLERKIQYIIIASLPWTDGGKHDVEVTQIEQLFQTEMKANAQ